MGVMINIYCDEAVVSPDEVSDVTQNMHSIVCQVMNKTDVFAFTMKSLAISTNDPIELFVQVNGARIKDVSELADKASGRHYFLASRLKFFSRYKSECHACRVAS